MWNTYANGIRIKTKGQVIATIVMTVLKTTHKQLYNKIKFRGRATSSVSRSALKRLMMRPCGVEPKNDTGALKRLSSIFVWRALEALSSATAKMKSRRQSRAPDAATSIPNTVM